MFGTDDYNKSLMLNDFELLKSKVFTLQTITVGVYLVPWSSLGVIVLIESSFSYPVWPWEETVVGFDAKVRGLIPLNVP